MENAFVNRDIFQINTENVKKKSTSVSRENTTAINTQLARTSSTDLCVNVMKITRTLRKTMTVPCAFILTTQKLVNVTSKNTHPSPTRNLQPLLIKQHTFIMMLLELGKQSPLS